jgi:GR25 family glycosyltransferase involved in LPS biosynthesis
MIINKIYMINLKRKKHIADNSLEKLKSLTSNDNIFSKIEIFEAVDGQLLDKNNINNELTLKAKYTLNSPSSYNDIRSYGEIGCYLSHTKIWKEIVNNNYSNCIIFEDDVIPKIDYETIVKYLENIPNDYDIAYLGWWSRKDMENINKNSYWFYSNYNDLNKENVLGLYSYIISNSGAKKLLSKAFPIDVQLDTYVSLYNNINKDFKRYLSKKQLFVADKTILGDANTHTVCDKCKFFQVMNNN